MGKKTSGSPQKKLLVNKILGVINEINENLTHLSESIDVFHRSLENTKFRILARNGDYSKNVNVVSGDYLIDKYKDFLEDFMVEYSRILELVNNNFFTQQLLNDVEGLLGNLNENSSMLKTRIKEVTFHASK